MTENNACESQFVCSFVNSTVQQCGLIEYKKTWPSRILPLTCCKDSVDSHLYKYSISRRSIDSESSLLKIRAGLFEEDDDTLTICPKHRGVCSRCRKELVQRMADKENRVEPNISQIDGYGEVTQCKQTVQGAKKAAFLQIDEENLQTNCLSMDSMDDCISESVYSQSSQYSEWQDSQESPSRKRKMSLNSFLETVDISPVKKTLTVDFDLASERTKNDYVRKAKRIMHSVLGILVPQQESLFEEVLYESNAYKDQTLESFSKAYSSMSSWGTQRQILSLLVQDYSYNQLKDYIPDLSRYKFSSARKHAEVVGVGKPVLQKKQFREKATIQQIENFLEFILSPAIMTDSPFGECTYKISSGITLKVPKIILNSVRTRTVTLYLKYCEETQNADILSERTYMRLLEAIEPNVRKSMKGLDNFAADGSQAFDNLKSVLHVSLDSEVPDHCGRFGLSSEENSFCSKCTHTHHLSCNDCEALTTTLKLIEDAADSITYTNQEQQDDTKYIIVQGIKTIIEWKKHIVRSVNQDRARGKVLDTLQPNEALIERDWAMKFLPLQYRESQSNWFAKRGLSWHVSVITFQEKEGKKQFDTWKQFEIGIGKVFSSKSLNEIPSLVKKCESTVIWRIIAQSSLNTSIPVPVTRNEELEEEDNICSNVFTCPEDGCIATFLKYGQLCNHLDRGKHTFPKNNLNIKERTQITHASLMESKSSAEKVLHSGTTHALQAESTLKKGWALKNKREVKRFSKEQIEYMTEKFQFGESTGYKCDPDDVAKEMRHVKNSKGIRKFQLEHFLSPSQIASFFSRLSLKKRQASNTVYDDCDMIAEESRTEMSQLTVLANTVQ
ncbi:Hypothetical predicted protein [Mytilus galloprovincialis]|uniref:C2H2-type domain-containing protein n=1 Tax=Mytilus galloprovincialis TaxID=29158 RepID=A0A8B6F3P8_MYTGA|nr:Hypothetical predicted protein [Mytilus galloprovincialis]